MHYFRGYIKKYWKQFFLAVLFLSVEAFCDLLQPTIMSRLIDIGVANKQMDYIIKTGGMMFFVTLIGASAAVVRNYVSSNVSQAFGTELRYDLYKKIQSFSFKTLNQFETASLVTRLTNDVTQLQNFVNGMMRIFVKAPLLCIGSLVMAIRLNPGLSVVLLIIVPVIAVIIAINLKLGYPLFVNVQRKLDQLNSVMREFLKGVRVVKAFNSFSYEQDRFENTNEQLSDISIKASKVMAVFSPIMSFLINIGIISVIWLGGIKVSHGGMQVGQIMAFINYMTQILFSLMMISHVFTIFARAKASTERIHQVLCQNDGDDDNDKSNDISTDIHLSLTPEPHVFCQMASLEFNNVYFSYSGHKEDCVLKNISFKANSGEIIGIIGATGSGKSSLVNLLPRFYDVIEGAIYIGDTDIRQIKLKDLREMIAIVPQKSVLFTGTILDNIRWGDEKAPLSDIQHAAQIAEAHPFIEAFPEKYETVIGQGGVNFSGGQKQRVSIARALVRKPDILILDDCTSAVDLMTESRIRSALKAFSQNLTCIIIAQKITSVMDADRILVLDHGEIVGNGTHYELLKTCPIYLDIYYSQFGKDNLTLPEPQCTTQEGGFSHNG